VTLQDVLEQSDLQDYIDIMNKTIDQIETEALGLDAPERAELAERLLESLASTQLSSGQGAWIALAKKRRDDIRSGAVTGIPGEEGSAMVRKLVGK
jgi:putative addiction module component (TIGR02574 family)